MRVEIELAPWVSRRLGHGMKPLRWQVEVTPDEDVAALFTRLAEDDGFRREVFDPEQQRLREAIAVSLNGRILASNEELKHVLREGDRLSLIMAITGGTQQ